MRLTNEEGFNLQDLESFKSWKEKNYCSHKRMPSTLAWSPEGTSLVTCQLVIKLWAFGEEVGLDKVHQMKAHQNEIESAKFGTNTLLATLSRDMIKFWDIREANSMKLLKFEKKNKSDFLKLSWSHSSETGQGGQKLAVLTKENVVNIYELRNTGTALGTINLKNVCPMEISTMEWDRSDSVLIVAGGESSTGSMALCHGSTFQCLPDGVLTTHCGKITDIVFNNANSKLATASEDSLIEIHDIPELICEKVFSNKLDSSFKNISFSCNGKYLAASSDSNYIDIYNVENGGEAFRIKCSSLQESLGWHPKKMVLAYIDEEDKKKSLDRNEDMYLHLFHQ